MQSRTAELLCLLLEPDRSVRQKALIELSTLGDPAALEELIRFAAAADRVGDERALAFRAIAASLQRPDPAARRFLLLHREDTDPFVRAAVLDGLARLRDERLAPFFRQGLVDPELLVRQAAHEAMRGLQSGRSPASPASPAEPARPPAAAGAAPPATMPPATGTPSAAAAAAVAERVVSRVRTLLQRLAGGGTGNLEEVTQQLAGLGPPAVGPLLAELRAPTVLQRMAVAQALGRIGDNAALGPLVARLKGAEAERDPQVLAVLLRAAGSLLRPHDLQHLDLLLELARAGRAGGAASDVFVRAAALDALARLPSGRSAAALLAALDDADPWVRETAARGLAGATPAPAPELVPTLAEALLRATRPEVLVGLLGALCKAYVPGSSVPSLAGRLHELMRHAEPGVREWAILACDALLSPTGTSPPPVDEGMLRILADRATDPQPEVRRAALEILADVAPPGYAPAAAPVRALARSADPAIARPALRVLGRVGDLDSVETMIEVAQGVPSALAREAVRLLEGLQGPIRVERDAAGRYQPVLTLSCGCGERPRWRTDALGRESLVCPGCRTGYLLTASGALAPLSSLPHGVCRCCRRPAALEQIDGTLRCPTTREEHLRNPTTGAVYRLSNLPHGGCTCCSPSVPLLESAGRISCPVSGLTYLRSPGGSVLPASPPGPPPGSGGGAGATRDPGHPPPSVEEVNRALLEGSLLLTQSGLPLLGDLDGDED